MKYSLKRSRYSGPVALATGEPEPFDFGLLEHEPRFRYSAQTGVNYYMWYSADGEWLVSKYDSRYTNPMTPTVILPNIGMPQPHRILTQCCKYLSNYFFIHSGNSYMDTNNLKDLPKIYMSKKLANKINPKKKKKGKKNNNLINNNLEDGSPGPIEDILSTPFGGMSLKEHLDAFYPLHTPTDMEPEFLLELRHAQYHAIIVACKMDVNGAKEFELLVTGRLKQIENEIDNIKYSIQLKKDIVDILG